MELPKRLTVEYYKDGAGAGAGGKRGLLYRYVITDFQNHDEALKRALERAKKEGRLVLSANFRPSKDQRTVEKIVVYVKEG